MTNESGKFETGLSPWFSSLIYFGRNKSSGGEVTEQQFADFLLSEVTPAFPAGMTVYDAYGQMQRENGEIVKQETKVVVLVHKKADEEIIQNIIRTYRKEFGNPQVMLIAKQVTPQFYND